MDILKDLFGTSDELQINKSLFGSDTSSTPVELGLGEDDVTTGRFERVDLQLGVATPTCMCLV